MGDKLVESLPGSEAARRKLRVILQTLSGEKSVAEATRELGIGEAMFHKLRHEFLEAAVGLLEPKALGRPKQEAPTEEIADLRRRLRDAEVEKEAAFLRAELAVLLPGVLRDESKKKRRNPDAGAGD